MRDASPAMAEALSGNHVVSFRVDSWYAGDLLLADVPVMDATLATSSEDTVPGRLTLTVPGTLQPRKPTDPLAQYGQRLKVWRGVTLADGTVELLDLGWFRVQSWAVDSKSVKVEALGLMAVLADYKLLTPTSTASTYSATLARLVDGMLPIVRDPAVADRAIPAKTWDTDRLAACYELADTWPARLRVDDTGTLRVLPDKPPGSVVATYADGQNGVLVSAGLEGTRDLVYNAVVATGETTDDNRVPVSAVATQASGPTAWGGPFGRVPLFYSSPLLTTTGQASAAAQTRLANAQSREAHVKVTASPDPRLQVDDRVRVVQDATGLDTTGIVTAIDLPLPASGGPMTLSVTVAGAL